MTQLNVQKSVESYQLDTDIGLLLPVDPELTGIDLFVDAVEDTTLELELWDTGRGENYVVITSYSIHYTKLYDEAPGFQCKCSLAHCPTPFVIGVDTAVCMVCGT